MKKIWLPFASPVPSCWRSKLRGSKSAKKKHEQTAEQKTLKKDMLAKYDTTRTGSSSKAEESEDQRRGQGQDGKGRIGPKKKASPRKNQSNSPVSLKLHCSQRGGVLFQVIDERRLVGLQQGMGVFLPGGERGALPVLGGLLRSNLRCCASGCGRADAGRRRRVERSARPRRRFPAANSTPRNPAELDFLRSRRR
jgi:hypothetical protein